MRTEQLPYIHDLIGQLAVLAEADNLASLAYLCRMAELEAQALLHQEDPNATAAGRRAKTTEGVSAN
jgi:hypothetical protein